MGCKSEENPKINECSAAPSTLFPNYYNYGRIFSISAMLIFNKERYNFTEILFFGKVQYQK